MVCSNIPVLCDTAYVLCKAAQCCVTFAKCCVMLCDVLWREGRRTRRAEIQAPPQRAARRRPKSIRRCSGGEGWLCESGESERWCACSGVKVVW
jgi:hypothetical protein